MYGVYIHVPFCRRKCLYCDFYSLPDLDKIPEYIVSLENQMDGFGGLLDTVYFGGGTPSLLSPQQVERLLKKLQEKFSFARDTEITIELNPDSCDKEKLKGFRDAGVNRISVGAQTFSNKSLQTIGRLHTAEQALYTIETAGNVGFKNISADLMLALPGEGEDTIAYSIDCMKDAGVSHVSAYLLKLMEGTPFYEKPPRDLPDDDKAADLYEFAVKELANLGYQQYEISNFALPGFESRHNLKYWNCDDYVGFGPTAHSSIEGTRYRFSSDLNSYLDCFREESKSPFQGMEKVGAVDGVDYLILKLRTSSGLNLKEWRERFGMIPSKSFQTVTERLQKAEYLLLESEQLRLTTKGMLLSNSILSELMAAMEQ